MLVQIKNLVTSLATLKTFDTTDNVLYLKKLVLQMVPAATNITVVPKYFNGTTMAQAANTLYYGRAVGIDTTTINYYLYPYAAGNWINVQQNADGFTADMIVTRMDSPSPFIFTGYAVSWTP